MTTICMDCQRTCGKATAAGGEHEVADAEAERTSHGLCVRCYATRMGAVPTDDLKSWVDSDLNRLPTGKIILNGKLEIIGYSKEEESLTGLLAEEIIGQEFFVNVAPCMDADVLSGWCRQHVDSDDLHEQSIDWLLKLRSGERVASLEMCAGKGRVTILVDLIGVGAA
ncbi:MAG: PAS domain-containing protein [Nannocystaceae bacterium]